MGVGFCTNAAPLGRRTARSNVCQVRASMAAGDKVRVKESVMMYHVPKQKEGVDVIGMEGTVVGVILEKNGAKLTYNRPVQVKFDEPKFSAHFEETELEVIS